MRQDRYSRCPGLEQPGCRYRTVGFRTRAEVIENLEALRWEISDADTAEIDVIFDRHGAITLPPGRLED
jgi:aryl-alcohol dehydrogenase-like predicted oxidoreductase